MSSFLSIDMFSSIAIRRSNREGDVCLLLYFRTAIRPGVDDYKVAVVYSCLGFNCTLSSEKAHKRLN